ncbi:unnamed protein product [Pedinophyceae sp. YPF-701]|nr:unnamed protein product [Pedinophyceae sp. YPF-701]
MDPFTLLKDYVQRDELGAVRAEGGNIAFGSDYVFPPSTLLAFKVGDGQAREDWLQLDVALHFAQFFTTRDAAGNTPRLVTPEYVKAAKESKLKPVGARARRDLLDILLGRTRESTLCVEVPPQLAAATLQAPEPAPAAPEAAQTPAATDDDAVRGPARILADVRAHQRPLRDRNSQLVAARGDFRFAIQIAARYDLFDSKGSAGAGGAKAAADRPGGGVKRPAQTDLAGGREKAPRGTQVPIIVVPQGLQTLINMWNIRRFLEEGKFETWQATKERMGGKPARELLILRRQGREEPVPYRIVDTYPARRDQQRCVVACVMHGAKWQFKDWPYKDKESGGVDLAHAMAAVRMVYLKWHDARTEQLPELVRNGNVRVLGLHRDNRHSDNLVAGDFWKEVDLHIARNADLNRTVKY